MSHSRLPMPACIAGIASIMLAAAVGAQTPATGTNQMGSNNATAKATAESVSSGDRKFLEKAAQGGMAEVELGKLAAQKAGSADVKQFGQRMVDDHQFRPALLHDLGEFLDLAAAEEGRRTRLCDRDDRGVDDLQVDGASKPDGLVVTRL